ncbi:MAG: oxygen-independent coproporphyrinogen III oxidase [Pseudomonadota bacterium]
MTRVDQQLPNLPRYTSYPTAPHFSRHQAREAHARLCSSIQPGEPVSVYVHVPFCDRLCWFCGCHTKHTLKYEPVARYMDVVVDEIGQFADRMGFRPTLGALHLGGGSPSMMRPAEAEKLRQAIEAAFEVPADVEVSVEVDPNDACDEMYEALAALGMNRASLGVQDFDEKVQKAINRPQGFEETALLVKNLRKSGIGSLNIDALYGLPFQTAASIAKTVKQVLSLDPDRIALFGYAHVPSVKKHQNMIDTKTLPDDAERIEQSRIAREIILKAGYEAIGIDHFAVKADGLAIAKRNRKLRRNFQGYTTDTARVLLGFGASSISSCEDAYLQNTVATNSYTRQVSEQASVAERGILLSFDDQIRAFIIQSLMCNFMLDTRELELKHGELAAPYLDEIRAVALDDEDGICRMNGDNFEIVPGRQEYVRVVAARFDAYLGSGASGYSKAI